MIKTIFAIYFLSYKDYVRNSKSRTASSRDILYYISTGYLALQLLSLTLPTSMENWGNFEKPAYILSLTRLDFLASSLSLSISVFVSIMVFLSLVFLVWVYLFIKLWRDEEYEGEHAKYLLSVPLALMNNLLFLPFLCTILGVYKYSLTSESPAFNYNDAETDSLSIGMLVILTFPLFVGFLVLELFEVMFNYDQFLTRSSSQTQAKSYAGLELSLIHI